MCGSLIGRNRVRLPKSVQALGEVGDGLVGQGLLLRRAEVLADQRLGGGQCDLDGSVADVGQSLGFAKSRCVRTGMEAAP